MFYIDYNECVPAVYINSVFSEDKKLFKMHSFLLMVYWHSHDKVLLAKCIFHSSVSEMDWNSILPLGQNCSKVKVALDPQFESKSSNRHLIEIIVNSSTCSHFPHQVWLDTVNLRILEFYMWSFKIILLRTKSTAPLFHRKWFLNDSIRTNDL